MINRKLTFVIILISLIFVSSFIHADVIVPGNNYLNYDIKITNTNDYPNYLFFAVFQNKNYLKNCDKNNVTFSPGFSNDSLFHISKITNKTYIPLISKFGHMVIYAVDKKNYSDQQLFDNLKYSLFINALENYNLYIKNTNNFDKINEFNKNYVNCIFQFAYINNLYTNNKYSIDSTNIFEQNIALFKKEINDSNHIILNLINLDVYNDSDYISSTNIKQKYNLSTTAIDPFGDIVQKIKISKSPTGELTITKQNTFRKLQMTWSKLLYFLLGLIGTILIEFLILLKLLKKHSFKKSKVFLYTFIFNLISYPIAMYLLAFLSFVVVEIIVVIIEFILIKYLFKFSWLKSFKYSFVINLVTAILGLLIPFIIMAFNILLSYF